MYHINPYPQLQPANLSTLCHSVVLVAQNHCPATLHKALVIEAQFKKVLSLFHDCHQLYDGNAITDDNIDKLGNQRESKL